MAKRTNIHFVYQVIEDETGNIIEEFNSMDEANEYIDKLYDDNGMDILYHAESYLI